MSVASFSCTRAMARCIMRGLVMVIMTTSAMAQPTGLLYDPEPPADSAYVRVLLISDVNKVSVMVNGKVRGPALTNHQVSDYMVLPVGLNQIALVSEGNKSATVSTQLDVARGRAMTIAFVSNQSSAAPIFFEDKTSSNKLKAMLSVYQLVSKPKTVDILTGDGATKVFADLAYGTSGGIQVNPISVELVATPSGEKTPIAKTNVTMGQGSAYSVFLLPGKNGKPSVSVVQNKIERYTGK
jgi:alginate O-acetyltransferase complex protein AlgF